MISVNHAQRFETDIPETVLASGRESSRALSAALSGPDRTEFARAFGFRLIAAWWSALTSEDKGSLPLREKIAPWAGDESGHLNESVSSLADEIGSTAASLDAEQAAYQIGLIYTGMLAPDHRAEFGTYYTPPSLTSRLLAEAEAAGVNWARARILDPACGGGAFLTPAARQILLALPDRDPVDILEHMSAHLRGYEIDPFAAWLSQVCLDAELLPLYRRAKQRLPVLVTVCDTLEQVPEEQFDLVIGNPPYGRVSLDPKRRARFKRGLYGHANLYGLFTEIALEHLRSNGVIAYVTPTSFLAGHYFKNLRALLAQEAPPVSFDFVSTRKGVFDDVLQETLLATYKREARCENARVHEITPISTTLSSVVEAGEMTLPPDSSHPWLLPRTAREAELVHSLSQMPHRLSDWGYSVSTGPLVWNRFKDQLCQAPGKGRVPLIWAEAVTAEGDFVFRALKKNHAPYFELRSKDDWLVVTSPCILLQRTTAKEQARRLIAACLPLSFLKAHGNRVVIENHLNMIKPTGVQSSIPVEVVSAFLNSGAADRVFRCVSGSVAVSAYELESMPLPAPDQLERLCSLVANGASRELIDAECNRLYTRKTS